MENKRLFIAVAIDPNISKDLVKKFNSLHLPWKKLKKVPADQMHLTLKFLGDFNIEKIPNLLNSLEKVDIGVSDIELKINQSQIFTPKQPKVLALSIEANPQLQKLYDQIEQILFDDGLAHKEIRRLSTHLTLARIKKTADFEEFKEFNDWKIIKSFFVTNFEIIESELSKAGPEYTTLQSFNL